MHESASHWMVDAVNRVEPGTFPPDVVPIGTDTAAAWQILLQHHGARHPSVAQLLATASGLKAVEVKHLKKGGEALFPESFCRKYGVLVYEADAALPLIATCDAQLPPDAQKQIHFLLGRDFELVLMSPDDLDTGLTYLYASTEITGQANQIDIGVSSGRESSIVQLAKALFREAIDKRASDIHIQPFVGGAAIRLRVDGVLQRIATVPKHTLDGLANYLNAQAGLDINPFIPQDGRLGLKYGERHYEIRLSLLPAFDGMRIVCRLLEQGRQFSLTRSGLSLSDRQALMRLIGWGSGMVLLTGPTGSGKTSTLYALLTELNTSDVNILTVEDPVEYVLPGISQVQVSRAQGRSFADALRAMLRQDPDIILVGEIRDAETAAVAAQAALTGHLVFSTLHTNDAMATIPRLLDLGLDASILADALIGVVSQRLVRKLCTHCRQSVAEPLSAMETEFLRITRERPKYRAVGCEQCQFSGYLGRLPLTEILEVSPALRTALLAGTREVNALQQASLGFKTNMGVCASQWIVSGETTAEEAHAELGLRFWNALAEQHQCPLTGQMSGLLASHHGRRPGIVLLSNRAELVDTLAGALDFEILAASNEEAAGALLKGSDAILMVVIDAALMKTSPRQWLQSLRAELAWSGVPVLFLVGDSDAGLKEILDEFNVHVMNYGRDADFGLRLAEGVKSILSKGKRAWS